MEASKINKWWSQTEDYFFLSCFVLWLWLIFSDYNLLRKCFSNWWSGCAWRWGNVVNRKWRGHTCWLLSLPDISGVAERFKLFAALEIRLSNKMVDKVNWRCDDNPGQTWKIKNFINYSRRLWNQRQIPITKSVSGGDRRCLFWTCSSRRSLDGCFRDKNCRKWVWRGSSTSEVWLYLVKQSLGTVTMLMNSRMRFLIWFVW